MKPIFKRGSLYLLIAIWSVLALSCKIIDPCEQKEIFRNTSQDNIVDYVVIEKDCGATTSVSTLIFVVPKGRATEGFHPVFKADKVEGLDVTWVAPKQMTIAYKAARIFSYSNFWQSRDVENFSYTVSIREYQK